MNSLAAEWSPAKYTDQDRVSSDTSIPVRGERRARLFPRQGKALARPLFVASVEQRQVEQPFAGIIDDVQRERAIGAVLPLIVDHEPQLADVDGRTGPAARVDQGADVVLVIEARHRVVRLRRKMRARDTSGGEGLEHRKEAAARHPMDQRGDEHGLARARQAGDAEPHCRIEEMLAVIEQRTRRQARLLENVGQTGSHAENGVSTGYVLERTVESGD